MTVVDASSEAALRGSDVAPWVIDSGARSNLLAEAGLEPATYGL